MIKTHIMLNEQNRVAGVYKVSQPYTIEITLSDSLYNDLIFNSMAYKYVSGSLIKDMSIFDEAMLEDKLNLFRAYRAKMLEKYDILRLNVMNGDLDPNTRLPYTPMTGEEKQWRLDMLNFTDYITKDTTESDYPATPSRLL